MRKTTSVFKVRVMPLVLLVLFTSGCFKYVADYDEAVLEEIYTISKKVDVFFNSLLETPVKDRGYDIFRNDYIDIEADLKSLLVRNEVRQLNEETVKQINIALDLWQKDKTNHKEKDTVKDFIAKKHGEQFARVFTAMAKAEAAKKIK